MNTSSAIVNSTIDKKLPGDLAMWFFILAELTVFAILFIGFAVAEQMNISMFSEGKSQLHTTAGLINTLALITSSFFVALSLKIMQSSQQLGRSKKAGLWLIVAMLFAGIYLGVKAWEYQFLFAQNIDIETNTFFTLYFMITGFHFMHVLLGMVILIFISVQTFKGRYQSGNLSGFESGACYWHMVDMLWIILFPLVYVI